MLLRSRYWADFAAGASNLGNLGLGLVGGAISPPDLTPLSTPALPPGPVLDACSTQLLQWVTC
jgi:hypothetical protein